MARRVIVTRPAPEAGRWASDLRQRGIDALELPLIEIAAPADIRPLTDAWNGISGFAALFFVSGNAVRGFFEAKPTAALVQRSWSATDLRAWAPGPGTAQALQVAGVPPECIDAPAPDAAQFDSEALWAVVRAQVRVGQNVLIVRGEGVDGRIAGRAWLADRLRAAGARVEQIAAYRRCAPTWSPAQRARAGAALPDGSIWLFSSSEAIANLQALLPLAPTAKSAAIATHPRIAESARRAGFGVVCESLPDPDSVVRSIELLGASSP